jgi:hypothetical protein
VEIVATHSRGFTGLRVKGDGRCERRAGVAEALPRRDPVATSDAQDRDRQPPQRRRLS